MRSRSRWVSGSDAVMAARAGVFACPGELMGGGGQCAQRQQARCPHSLLSSGRAGREPCCRLRATQERKWCAGGGIPDPYLSVPDPHLTVAAGGPSNHAQPGLQLGDPRVDPRRLRHQAHHQRGQFLIRGPRLLRPGHTQRSTIKGPRTGPTRRHRSPTDHQDQPTGDGPSRPDPWMDTCNEVVGLAHRA